MPHDRNTANRFAWFTLVFSCRGLISHIFLRIDKGSLGGEAHLGTSIDSYGSYIGVLYGVCGSRNLLNLCITSAFSRQMANCNAGPASALEPMGRKQYF